MLLLHWTSQCQRDSISISFRFLYELYTQDFYFARLLFFSFDRRFSITVGTSPLKTSLRKTKILAAYRTVLFFVSFFIFCVAKRYNTFESITMMMNKYKRMNMFFVCVWVCVCIFFSFFFASISFILCTVVLACKMKISWAAVKNRC